MQDIDTKEVAVVKQQATKALTAAQGLEIASQADMEAATDHLSRMKKVGRMIKERKEAITKPLNDALKSARDLFRPVEDDLAEAERVVKGKMLSWQRAEDERAEKERVRLAQRVERGTMKAETAVAKMGEIQEAPRSVEGKTGRIATRKVKKVRFTPLAKLTGADAATLLIGGYLQWDEVAARRDALAGKEIPGVEVYEEDVIAAS